MYRMERDIFFEFTRLASMEIGLKYSQFGLPLMFRMPHVFYTQHIQYRHRPRLTSEPSAKSLSARLWQTD